MQSNTTLNSHPPAARSLLQQDAQCLDLYRVLLPLTLRYGCLGPIGALTMHLDPSQDQCADSEDTEQDTMPGRFHGSLEAMD